MFESGFFFTAAEQFVVAAVHWELRGQLNLRQMCRMNMGLR
jgi:hypothetical protein